MAVVRKALIGLLAAILAVAAMPAASYSAAVGGTKKETKAQKLARELKACKREKSKSKREACEKKAKKCYCTQPSPEQRRRIRESREVREREERGLERPTTTTTPPTPYPPTAPITTISATPGPTPPRPTVTQPPPEAPTEVASAMLTVYAYTLDGSFGRHLVEGELVRITRLGVGEEALGTIETHEYIVHVVPGRYKVTAGGGLESASTEVEVTAGQELIVTLYIPTLYIPAPPRQTEEKAAR